MRLVLLPRQLHRSPRSFVSQRHETALPPTFPQLPFHRSTKIRLLDQNAARKDELNLFSLLNQTSCARRSIRRQAVRRAFENVARDFVVLLHSSKDLQPQSGNVCLARGLYPTDEVVWLIQLQGAQ